MNYRYPDNVATPKGSNVPHRKNHQRITGDASALGCRPSGGRRPYLVGIATCVAAAFCTSLLEFAMLSWAAAPCRVPWSIAVATWGRVSLTHAAGLLPVMILVSLPLSALLARWGGPPRPPWRAGTPAPLPEPWHAASVVAVAGVLVGYGDSAQYEYVLLGSAKLVPWHILVATGTCAVAVLAGMRLLTKTRLIVWYRRVLNAAAATGTAAFIAAPFLMSGTPLAGPAMYSLSPIRLVDRAPAKTGPPSVLFIVIDTVRADHLSHYGHNRDTTPFIESLSDKGVTFDRALAAGTWTPPSHASMFTGLTVREHGVGEGLETLDDTFETAAERARAAGFQTVAFSSNAHIDTSHQFLQGFYTRYPVWAAYTRSRSFLHHWMTQLDMVWPAAWLEYDDGAALTNTLVADWIAEGYTPDRPFLMFINYMEAHAPHRPPLAYSKLFLDAAAVKRAYALDRQYDRILGAKVQERYAMPPGRIPEEDLAIYRGLYDASIRYLDDRIRELFALLDVNQLLDNTVVILVSDHGEGLGEHGIFEHRYTVYDMLIRVPLTIYVPRHQSPPGRIGEAVSTAALFDVVCAAVEADYCPDAETLARIMIDRAGGKPVVSEKLENARLVRHSSPLHSGLRRLQGYRAMSDATMKYIKAADGSEELYDISIDPREVTDLAGRKQHLCRAYSSRLMAWLDRTTAFDQDAVTRAEMTPAQIGLLHSLGYVDP